MFSSSGYGITVHCEEECQRGIRKLLSILPTEFECSIQRYRNDNYYISIGLKNKDNKTSLVTNFLDKEGRSLKKMLEISFNGEAIFYSTNS